MYSPSLLDHVNIVGKDDRIFLVATVNEERELVGLIEVWGGHESIETCPSPTFGRLA